MGCVSHPHPHGLTPWANRLHPFGAKIGWGFSFFIPIPSPFPWLTPWADRLHPFGAEIGWGMFFGVLAISPTNIFHRILSCIYVEMQDVHPEMI